VLCCAGQTICQEDLGRDDYRLLVIVRTALMLALAGLALESQILAMAAVLCPEGHLRKTA
jgi:hypothetical protein